MSTTTTLFSVLLFNLKYTTLPKQQTESGNKWAFSTLTGDLFFQAHTQALTQKWEKKKRKS